MKKPVLLLTLLTFTLSFILGCQTFTKKKKASPNESLVPAMTSRFNDVPVPTEFKFMPGDSYSFENSGVRVGVLSYQGQADIDQVLAFYKEQMPMFNWRLLNIIEYNQRILNFDRDSESCIVTLMPKGNSVIISVYLGPKSQFPRKADKPIK
jgi:hypothetical protein